LTATNIVLQPKHRCLHVVTDGASYNQAGVVQGFATKVFTAPNWPGIITGRGIASAPQLFGQRLSWKFQSFDDLVDGIEAVYLDIADELGLTEYDIELIIAGWSFERDQPESYVIYPNEQLGHGMTEEILEARLAEGKWSPKPVPFKLMKLPGAVDGPFLNEAIKLSSDYGGIDIDEPPEKCIARMHHVIECQRHDVWAHDQKYYIGGFAQVTTVTPDGISQRILSRWPDKTGELICPSPPDWEKWKTDHWKCLGYGQAAPSPHMSAHVAAIVPDGLSRLQRRRMEKKIRKGKLTAAAELNGARK
jgi:hypothetical protein